MDTIETKLKEPFSAKDIEWRISRQGLYNGKPKATCLAYLTARAVMDRLDEVVGSTNWSTKFTVLNSGVLCQLSVTINGTTVTREDGCEPSDIEPFKGALSGAFKRAAVQFGIGRYLYHLEEASAVFVTSDTKGARKTKMKEDGNWYSWIPPSLPAWALPKGEATTATTTAETITAADTFVPSIKTTTYTDHDGGAGDFLMTFGKYKGQRIKDVGPKLGDYIRWLSGQEKKSPSASALIEAFEEYSNGQNGTATSDDVADLPF